MFPMIGALFLLVALGIALGIIALLFKKSRHFAAYFVFSSVLASLCAFSLFWGSGLLIEKLFGATRWSTLGAFIGYVSGLFFGAAIGIYLARRINTKLYN
ncbi:MAG: hypothetical protein HY035_06510 [Nitrospirae bacterium]|nr:hypothetical protein [Nitrospirota bacterium]